MSTSGSTLPAASTFTVAAAVAVVSPSLTFTVTVTFLSSAAGVTVPSGAITLGSLDSSVTV